MIRNGSRYLSRIPFIMSGPLKGFSHQERFQPGDYYYNEDGYIVMTEQYLLRRGYCCKSGCKHCPYGFGPEGLRKEMERRRSDH